jgi:hypothetical protein
MTGSSAQDAIEIRDTDLLTGIGRRTSDSNRAHGRSRDAIGWQSTGLAVGRRTANGKRCAFAHGHPDALWVTAALNPRSDR